MILINKHSRVDSGQLKALLNFVQEDLGYTTDHVGVTILDGNVDEKAVKIHTKYLNEKGEEVCCTELFPEYEEEGDKYGCGLSIQIEIHINEKAVVDHEVEIEHVRLRSLSEEPIPVKSWEDEFVYEMAKLVALFKEGVIGQFIHKRHWWYRTQKHALERLLAWKNTEEVEDTGTVDLFDDVFKPKTQLAAKLKAEGFLKSLNKSELATVKEVCTKLMSLQAKKLVGLLEVVKALIEQQESC